MKTISTIILAVTFLAFAGNVKAQSAFNNEPVTAESLISMMEGQGNEFAISPMMVQQNAEGLAVKWQTMNEKTVASFELEVSADKKNFTSCKRLDAGVGAALYQVDLNTNLIQDGKNYFRIKIILKNGAIGYTELTTVKMKKVK